MRDLQRARAARILAKILITFLIFAISGLLWVQYITYRRIEVLVNQNVQLGERTYALAVELAQIRQENAKSPPWGASSVQEPSPGSEADELFRLLRAPVLEQINLRDWEGRQVKVAPFKLRHPVDPRRLAETLPDIDWKPDPARIETTLPFPWPREYLERFHQPFNPDTMMMNLAALTNWVKRGRGTVLQIRPYLDFLLNRLDSYLTPALQSGRLVTYRFDYQWHDKLLLSGWVSPYGNASILAGLLYLRRLGPNTRAEHLADALYEGLLALEGRDMPWVTFVDAQQYVWFEEYPLPDRKAHVINGHIWITLVIAEYCLEMRKAAACTLAKAGLTTIKRYISEFRSPGRTNRYDLYVPYNADYFPGRIIRYQDALFELTGDPYFRHMANAFATDMLIPPPGKEFAR